MGFTRFTTGDLGGLEDAEQSIEIARAINSPDVVRSLGNFASCLKDLGQLERAGAIVEEARVEAVRLGRGIYVSWLDAERVIYRYYAGRWDDSVDLAEQTIDELETSGSPSFMEPAVRAFLALILLARDDSEAALEETAKSLELGRRAKDSQVLHPALATFALVRARVGLLEEASDAADELLADWSRARMLGTAEWLPDITYVLAQLGRRADLDEALGRVRVELPWLDAARAYAAGDPGAAAAIFGEVGNRPDEAYMRLQSEIDTEVRKAIDFYRTVGATRYLREAEAMLAATA
jgi:tetratricopeptide (TPR) repeat protein